MKVTFTDNKNCKRVLVENFTLYLPYNEADNSFSAILEDLGNIWRVKAFAVKGKSNIESVTDHLSLLNFYPGGNSDKFLTSSVGGFQYHFIVEELGDTRLLTVTKWEKAND